MKRIALLLALLSAVDAAVAGAASTPTLTLAAPTELSGQGDQFYSGGVIWFRPAGSGSFKLNVTGNGISSVDFPDVSSTPGWSGSTGGTDTSSPFSSPVAYTWTAGAGAPGAQTITGTTDADEPVTKSVTISADATGPTGQTVALAGGPFFAVTSVPLTIARGTDAQSGVAASGDVVERAEAPLQNGRCGAYGSFAAVTLVDRADTGIATGKCYRWQLKVTDNVGNVSAASPPSEEAKVDTTPPTPPTLAFGGLVNAGASGNVVYYRPSAPVGFTVAAAASDPESGVSEYSFPSIAGATQVATRASKTFSFTSLAAPPAAELAVTATNAAGLTSGGTSFRLVPDSTPPALSVLCDGGACRTAAYPSPVRVTFVGADGAGSGLDAIRYTTNGTTPTSEAGFEYRSAIFVRTLTHLKVRAFDRAGNASGLLSLTIRSLADRLLVTTPPRVTVPPGNRLLKARLSSSQRTRVVAQMTGRGLSSPQRWRFMLESGSWIVQLRLPAKIERGRVYTVRWTLSTGAKRVTRVTRVRLR